MNVQIAVRLATAQDVTRIAALLEANDLPTADLADSHPEFLILEQEAALVGVGGLELFGELALLRSVAVARDRQKTGELERHAAQRGIRDLVLLTQTAERFFARHGYQRIERSAAPGPLQTTPQFRLLCPASATCMSKRLGVSSTEPV
jgi:amino-acid N-acetyltransferase